MSAIAIATWPRLHYIAFAEREAADAAADALGKLRFRCTVSGRGEPLSPEAAALDEAVSGNEHAFDVDPTEFYLTPFPFGDSLDAHYLVRALAAVTADTVGNADSAVFRVERQFGGEGRGRFGENPDADQDDRWEPEFGAYRAPA